MKTECNPLDGLRFSVCLFALAVGLSGEALAAPDSFAPLSGSVSARTSETSDSPKPAQAGSSSSAVPSSGSAAVPSSSSALSSPSSVLPLPGSSSPIASTNSSGFPVGGGSSQPLAPSPSASLPPAVPLGVPVALGVPSLKKDDPKSLNAIEARVSDSVKDVIKNLGSMTETATLEDINVARQAVAKLEAMIDIERRLSELEKVRNDRSKGSAASAMAAAIPASALLPLPASKPPASSKSSSEDSKPVSFAPMSMGSSYELNRVVGSNGRYRAVIKAGEGSEKTYRAGDKLPDGSIVQEITPTSAVLKRNGDKTTLRIKGVDMVFNGR